MRTQLLFSSITPVRRSLAWLLFLLVGFPWLAQAQCPTGDINLTSQAQVDAFPPSCFLTDRSVFITGGDITNLNGLQKLRSVRGELKITSNPQLTSIAGLGAVTFVQNRVQISNNAILPTLDGLNNIRSVSISLELANNPQLISIAALTALTNVNGVLQISGNALLPTLAGLDNLRSVGIGLELVNNPRLISIAALKALTSISSIGVNIRGNAILPTLDGLNNLQSIGGLQLMGNPQLTSIVALTALTSVKNSVVILNNASLLTLEGLNNLGSVGDGLLLGNNPQLTSIAALTALTSVRNVQIGGNTVLPTLEGLNNLQSVGGSIAISDNPRLAVCALGSICNLLAQGVPRTIERNAPGCSSQQEVQDNCSPLAITTQPPTQSAVCAGSTVTASVSASDNARAYQWYKGDQPVAGQTTNTLSLTNVQTTDAGRYRVVVSNSVSSLTSTAFTLTVNPSPSVSINTSAAAICPGGVATLVAQGADGYVWSTGQTTASIRVSATGTYSVTGTSSAGCSAIATSSVTVNPTPSVSISPSASTVCAGQTVALSATPGLSSYRWSTGQTTASISVSASGNYIVTATNASGCSASATASVTVNPTPPTPTLTTATNQPGQLYPGGQSSVTVPQYSGIVTLLINGCNGTINWQVPNGSSGSSTSIPVATSATGSFVYQATCQQNGCPSAVGSATVVVQSGPLTVVAPLFDCATGKLTLRTTGGNGQPIEYQIPSVTNGWQATNPVSIEAKDFKKSLKLRARQRSVEKGGYDSAELDYQLPTCTGARIEVSEAPVAALRITVLGNPVTGQSVSVEVRGAEGQPVQLSLTNLQGRTVSERSIPRAEAVEAHILPVGNHPRGMLLLRVSTPTQSQTVKVLKAE